METHLAEADEIKHGLERLAPFLNEQLIVALTDAARTEEAWSRAAADVNAFLAEHNVDAPPPDTEISFFRAYPNQPPRLNCGPGAVEVCESGPTQTIAVVWIEITVPGRNHKTRPFKLRIPLVTEDVPTFHCTCVPIADLAVSPVRAAG